MNDNINNGNGYNINMNNNYANNGNAYNQNMNNNYANNGNNQKANGINMDNINAYGQKVVNEIRKNTNDNNSKIANEWGEFTPEDIMQNKTMAILSYLFPIVPFFAEKNSKWVRFHAVQGMNLWVASMVLILILTLISVTTFFIPVIGAIFGVILGLLIFVISFGAMALTIMGIVNVCNGKAKVLPLISNIRIFNK